MYDALSEACTFLGKKSTKQFIKRTFYEYAYVCEMAHKIGGANAYVCEINHI